MFRTTLALAALVISLAGGCITDDTKTIDPTVDPTIERNADDVDPGGATDDTNGCHLRRPDGELDCPTE